MTDIIKVKLEEISLHELERQVDSWFVGFHFPEDFGVHTLKQTIAKGVKEVLERE